MVLATFSAVKLVFLALLLSVNSFATQTGPACETSLTNQWFESTGIHKKKLFSDSIIDEKPIEMTVTIQDWDNVQKNPEREKATSPASFKIGDITLEGSVEARGKSRFNLFRTRALTFKLGDEDLKVVNRNGGFKSQPKLTSADQNARVLVEYLIYKINEILNKESAVKTRLGLITYVNPAGKTLDKGYGFFLEGKGQISKRLGHEETNSFDYPFDSVSEIPDNLFRALILDGDITNMINNFIYMKDGQDPKFKQRIAYDFDLSFLAPPNPLKLESIPTFLKSYRDWLEKSYELGTTGSHDYPPFRKGTDAQKAEILNEYRKQIIISAQKLVDQSDLILKTIPWNILPGDYKVSVKSWFEAAFKETEAFIKAHGNP